MQRQILGVKKYTLSNYESKRWQQLLDRTWLDLVGRKKQDLVLKNPSSYVNAFMVNQTLGTSIGLRPDKIAKYQSEAIKEMNRNKALMYKIAEREMKGLNVWLARKRQEDGNQRKSKER